MTHYEDQRWVAATSPEVMAAVLSWKDDEKFRNRFFDKVDFRTAGDDECHIWTASLSDEGYGGFRVVGKGKSHVVRAHRVAYVLRFGEIPEWGYLDHAYPVCRYRFCVNTDHLEIVDHAENVRRGTGVGRSRQREMRDKALATRDEFETALLETFEPQAANQEAA